MPEARCAIHVVRNKGEVIQPRPLHCYLIHRHSPSLGCVLSSGSGAGEGLVLPTARQALLNPLLGEDKGLGISVFAGGDRARARRAELLLAIALVSRDDHEGARDPSACLELIGAHPNQMLFIGDLRFTLLYFVLNTLSHFASSSRTACRIASHVLP